MQAVMDGTVVLFSLWMVSCICVATQLFLIVKKTREELARISEEVDRLRKEN